MSEEREGCFVVQNRFDEAGGAGEGVRQGACAGPDLDLRPRGTMSTVDAAGGCGSGSGGWTYGLAGADARGVGV